MSHTFDNLYLPGGDSFVSPDNMNYSTDFTAINTSMLPHSTENLHTVSPQELMNHNLAMSAPSSTAFAPLSTPGSGYLESPFLGTGSPYTSPLIDGSIDDNLYYPDFHDNPLFPPDGSDLFGGAPMVTDTQAYNSSFGSAVTASSELPDASPMGRQKSSPGRPPTGGSGHARKHSSVAGVKPTKARRPLEPIIIAVADSKEDAKRKKNTAAARKSRQRKQECQELLEVEVERLTKIVLQLGGNPYEGSALNDA